MCALRPLATTLGPLTVRDLPREIVQDGFRHTWRSYSRTLNRVVVEHRVVPDLCRVTMPTVLVHGRSDHDAPLAYVEAAVAAASEVGRQVELDLLDGDHQLAVREPEAVAAVIERRSGR